MDKQAERRIYLDLDGVIFPYWRDTGDVNPQPELTSEWVSREEMYYPTIVERLGSIAARNTTILLSSSRSMDALVYQEYTPIIEAIGGANQWLEVAGLRGITEKAEAIHYNWNGIIDLSNAKRGWERQRSLAAQFPTGKAPGSRAVWIDDWIRAEELQSETSRRVLSDPTLLAVRPLGSVGLTMAQLDTVEQFLFEE
jgi:hypothetical protein